MHNLVLSPIDPEQLISDIAERVTINILKALQNNIPPSEKQERLLTIQEAAQFLNLSVPTIYSKVSKRELPHMKRSKRLYFSNVELVKYLKEGKRKSYKEVEQQAETYIKNKEVNIENALTSRQF
ncbi:MAG: helix-turn-helix domain-containing protein [Chitinophagales bacterium]